ncbi:hypothetical protein, partial [Agromyces mediolanus]|uniref:hypothetical protein n=1 Tax=Agromyces mediolanus TaxID=41986 RepID=UPI001E542DF4
PVGGGLEDQPSGGVGALVSGRCGFWGFESGAEPSGALPEPGQRDRAGKTGEGVVELCECGGVPGGIGR